MVERRKAHRIQEKAEVRIRLADSEDELACKIIHQLTQDLSLIGIRIQCNVFIPVHSLLKIELSLKKPLRFISVLGRVRWVKAIYEDELYEMGVEFVDTPQEALRLLEMHIEEFPS